MWFRGEFHRLTCRKKGDFHSPANPHPCRPRKNWREIDEMELGRRDQIRVESRQEGLFPVAKTRVCFTAGEVRFSASPIKTQRRAAGPGACVQRRRRGEQRASRASRISVSGIPELWVDRHIEGRRGSICCCSRRFEMHFTSIQHHHTHTSPPTVTRRRRFDISLRPFINRWLNNSSSKLAIFEDFHSI